MKSRKMRCFIAFGANLGRPRQTIARAIHRLARLDGIRFVRVSSLYKTEPIGPAQPDYLNAAAQIQTDLEPESLLKEIFSVERELGRVRRRRNGPRTIDIDLLAYGDVRRRGARLTLPHPRYHRRRFVLAPLREIAPHVRHPVLKRTHKQLLSKLTVRGQRVTIFASWNGKQFALFKPKKTKNSRSSR